MSARTILMAALVVALLAPVASATPCLGDCHGPSDSPAGLAGADRAAAENAQKISRDATDSVQEEESDGADDEQDPQPTQGAAAKAAEKAKKHLQGPPGDDDTGHSVPGHSETRGKPGLDDIDPPVSGDHDDLPDTPEPPSHLEPPGTGAPPDLDVPGLGDGEEEEPGDEQPGEPGDPEGPGLGLPPVPNGTPGLPPFEPGEPPIGGPGDDDGVKPDVPEAASSPTSGGGGGAATPTLAFTAVEPEQPETDDHTPTLAPVAYLQVIDNKVAAGLPISVDAGYSYSPSGHQLENFRFRVDDGLWSDWSSVSTYTFQSDQLGVHYVFVQVQDENGLLSTNPAAVRIVVVAGAVADGLEPEVVVPAPSPTFLLPALLGGAFAIGRMRRLQ